MKTFALRASTFLALLVWSMTDAAAATVNSFPLLQNEGVIGGYGDGSFKLWKEVTRAEAIKVLVASDPTLSAEAAARAPLLSTSADPEARQWYAPYVRVAGARELIHGFPDGSMRPNAPLTVAEAVTLLHRFSRIRRPVPFLTSSYLQNREGQWYTEAVSAAIARKFVTEPLDLSLAITRAEFFAMVERLRVSERSNSYAYDASAYRKMPPAESPTVTSRKPFTVTIPALQIEDMDVLRPEGFDSQEEILTPLDAGLGHLFSFPGEGGKVMIYGHSSNWPWVSAGPLSKPFEDLIEMQKDDRILVTYEGTVYTYAVTHRSRKTPQDLSSFASDSSGEELILYTCWPPYSTRERLLVHARLLQATQIL